MDKGWENLEAHDGKGLDFLEETVGGNIKGEISDRSEGHTAVHWRTGDTCYKVEEQVLSDVLPLGGGNL